MKAISPVRSARSCYKAVCCISEQSLVIGRNKHSCVEEPVGALRDMNDCYSRLKELVPSIPQDESVSQVEILQHVIDYIFDLQIALQAEEAAAPKMVLSIKVRTDCACVRVRACLQTSASIEITYLFLYAELARTRGYSEI